MNFYNYDKITFVENHFAFRGFSVRYSMNINNDNLHIIAMATGISISVPDLLPLTGSWLCPLLPSICWMFTYNNIPNGYRLYPNSPGSADGQTAHCPTQELLSHWGTDKIDTISQMTFSEWKGMNFAKISLKFFPEVQINSIPSLGSDNGLTAARRQAIIWTNDG